MPSPAPSAPTARSAATPRTLAGARETFLAAIMRDTPGTDLPRYVAVLDDLIAWSVARADRLAFRADSGRGDALSFGPIKGKGALWSAQTVARNAPFLEIAPAGGVTLTAECRAHVMATLNAHSRAALVDGDRLRIGFAALKNVAARTAVLALLDELLDQGCPPASAPSAE